MSRRIQLKAAKVSPEFEKGQSLGDPGQNYEPSFMRLPVILLLLLLCSSALAAPPSVKSYLAKHRPGYQVSDVRESGDWAMCTWVYGESGGMALLHRWQGSWEIATSGGGAMSTAELAIFGVPRSHWSALLGHQLSGQDLEGGREIFERPYWTWLTSKKRLTDKDLEQYSGLELSLMRNEIFALYGRTFQDPYLRATFASRRWYKPSSVYSDSRLSVLERANAEFISAYQRRTGKL